MRRLRAGWAIVKTAVTRFLEGSADVSSASIAYFTALSLAPLLVLAVAIAGSVFGAATARARLVHDLGTIVDPSVVAPIEALLTDAALDTTRWWKVAVGLGVAIWSASRIFLYLQEALNRVWGVRAKSGESMRERVRSVARKRLVSFVVVASIGLILFASLALEWTVGIALHFVGDWWFATRLVDLAMVAVTNLAMAGFLMVTYRYLPDVALGWRDVWVGALATTVLLALGGRLMRLYLEHFGGSAAGAAGGIAVLLLWAYFDAQVLLFGAELSRACTEARRGRPRAESHAELDDCADSPIPSAHDRETPSTQGVTLDEATSAS
jgi:membrane protein